jgi:hypothetical protein
MGEFMDKVSPGYILALDDFASLNVCVQ